MLGLPLRSQFHWGVLLRGLILSGSWLSSFLGKEPAVGELLGQRLALFRNVRLERALFQLLLRPLLLFLANLILTGLSLELEHLLVRELGALARRVRDLVFFD